MIWCAKLRNWNQILFYARYAKNVIKGKCNTRCGKRGGTGMGDRKPCVTNHDDVGASVWGMEG